MVTEFDNRTTELFAITLSIIRRSLLIILALVRFTHDRTLRWWNKHCKQVDEMEVELIKK